MKGKWTRQIDKGTLALSQEKKDRNVESSKTEHMNSG